jgi:hypothetical protein
MDVTKAIKAIEDKLETLLGVRSSEQFNSWQKSTILTLINIYSESDKRVKSLEEIEAYSFYAISGIDRTHKAIVEARELLQNLVKDIQDFGLLQKKVNSANKSDININVHQKNTQNQSTKITIKLDFLIEIFKDELKGFQVKELKEILDSELDEKDKKKNFFDKIKSFGADVASNVLASLMTNPAVYNQLRGMF